MIMMSQIELINKVASESRAAQKRKEEAEEEMNAKFAQIEAEDQEFLAMMDELETSEYKENQKEYVESIINDYENNLCENLSDYMELREINTFYRALLEYVKNRIPTEPLNNNNNELTFYVIYKDLRKVLKNMNYTGGMSKNSLITKLEILCEFKLLRNITDEEMNPKALYVANKFKDNVSRTMYQEHNKRFKVNRRNHYVLNSLSKQNQLQAMDIVKTIKTYNLRQKNITSNSLVLLFGEDHGVVVQKEANVNPTKLKNFVDAANILLSKQGYYTEEQLRIQYMKKDRAIKKKDAIPLTAEYLAGVNLRVGAVRTRVNKDTRESKNIPSKIRSNSVIYIPREDN